MLSVNGSLRRRNRPSSNVYKEQEIYSIVPLCSLYALDFKSRQRKSRRIEIESTIFYLSSSCNVSDLMKLGFLYIRAQAEAKAIHFFDLRRCCCRFNVNRKLDSL